MVECFLNPKSLAIYLQLLEIFVVGGKCRRELIDPVCWEPVERPVLCSFRKFCSFSPISLIYFYGKWLSFLCNPVDGGLKENHGWKGKSNEEEEIGVGESKGRQRESYALSFNIYGTREKATPKILLLSNSFFFFSFFFLLLWEINFHLHFNTNGI